MPNPIALFSNLIHGIATAAADRESRGSHVPDALEDVTEVKPVTRPIAPSNDILDEGVNVTLARRVLRADQQTLLEESVHDVPVECLHHESKVDEGNRDLHRDWHQKFKACLEADIWDIIAVEAKTAKRKPVPRSGPFLSSSISSISYLPRQQYQTG
ncbi:hypothetical protein EDB19DRAFT_2028387 [Suillus lakei]|nr:hypothetical protein EDB19DRAFT_2028387 [Suillus lakei]